MTLQLWYARARVHARMSTHSNHTHTRAYTAPCITYLPHFARLRPLQVARKEDSKWHVRRTASPRSRLRLEMPELIKQALATEPIRFCAALLITPPLFAVSGGPGRVPHFGTNSAVSILTPPPFKPSTGTYSKIHYFLFCSRTPRGRLELSRSTTGYLEPPRVISNGRDVSSRPESLYALELSCEPLSPLRMTRSAQDDSVRYETSHVLRHCKVPLAGPDH